MKNFTQKFIGLFSLVFIISFTVNAQEIGDEYEGGYIFKINVDGTALVVDTANLGYTPLGDAFEAADSSISLGHDDWYLPSNRDMILIISTGVVDLQVDGAAAWYWTGSVYSSTSYGYRVNSGNSSLSTHGATHSCHVRAIRKVTLFDLPESNSTTIGDYRDGGYIFQVNENGTGLIADFQDLENDRLLETMTWAENTEAAENSTAQGFDDWYAPSVEQMLLMYNTIGPGGSNVADLKADWYWSSEEYTDPAYGWRVSYSNASVTAGGKNSGLYRCRAIRSVNLFEQTVFYGCTDENAYNYDENATDDDETCVSEPVVGMLYEGGYIFKINVDGTALVVDSENILGGEGYLQEPMKLSDAIEAAENSNAHGHDDWYLPSNRDMILLSSTGVVDIEVYGAAAWYWTRSVYSSTSYGYRVNSGNSSLSTQGATHSCHVRAIRKVTLFNLPESNSTTIGDYRDGGYIFQVNENGTGLIADFQDLENGAYLEQMTWAQNTETAENSTAQGFDDWYAPSVEQMQVIYNTIGPGGSNVADLKADWYWSSEEYTNAAYGWMLYYGNGNVSYDGKNSGLKRCRAIRNVVLVGEVILGCTDETAFNYNSSSNMDDGSCIPVVMGCMEADAFNFNADANTDDGNCIAIVTGCLDETASNFNPDANTENNSCVSWEELANDLQGQLNTIVPEDGVSQADLDAAQSEADNLANNLAIAESDFSEAMDYILNLELDLVSATEALVTAEANAANASAELAVAMGNQEDGIGQDDVDAAYDAGVASVDVPEILTENISVALPQGWSLIGYTCVESINVMEGFVSISEKIDIVKDEWGLAYIPEWGFSAFDNLDFGEGYQIKMIEEVTDFQFCPTITGTN
jgi:hypothetical protein